MTTGIEWTEETWNPLVGCEWASPGCDGCYAARDAAGRLKSTPTYQGLAVRMADGSARFTGELRLLPDRLDQPLRWQRARRIFVNSMSDLFHPDVPSAYIAEVFAVMALARRHTFQVLTKRPARMAKLLSSADFREQLAVAIVNMEWSRARTAQEVPPPWPLPNVWLGTSVESQEYAWRVEHVRKTPAAVRWVSVEPLVGPITDASTIVRGMDWIVAGGESGPRARPMHPDWLRTVRDECDFRDVAFLVKQWGEWVPRHQLGGSSLDGRPLYAWVERDGTTYSADTQPTPDGAVLMAHMGKRAAGRKLDGKVWDEYPVARS